MIDVVDLNRLGEALPPARIQPDGLLLRRPFLRRRLLVPWTRIKGVRIAPADRWSGKNGVTGEDGYYMVQVRLAGGWRRLGRVLRVWHGMSPEWTELFHGQRRVLPAGEVFLRDYYELVRDCWEAGGGTPGEEDDNWLRLAREVQPRRKAE